MNQESNNQGKVVIFSAPSGAGKTSIVQSLLKRIPSLEFSISACSRAPRKNENHGKDYFFMSSEEFKENIKKECFLEWEEVYEDQFYGTLRSEIERLWEKGLHILFDIDVKGALSLKKAYPEQSLVIFVKPPSVNILHQRLKSRKTESVEKIQKRIAKASEELQYETSFDKVLVNDQLEEALKEAEHMIEFFLHS